MKKAFSQTQQGFTLIELLVVIGVLAVLLAITLVAINPAKQFQAANNTTRQSNVNAILNAINQYQSDNRGQLPAGVATCTTTACEITGVTGSNNVDVCPALVTKYLAALPVDPSINNGAVVSPCNATYDSGYKVQVSTTDNRVTITAPLAQGGAVISVTR